MTTSEVNSTRDVFILIAQGFEGGTVAYLVEKMREEGLQVQLVGITAGLIRGNHGLTIRPDILLGQIPKNEASSLIVLPGGSLCASTLVAEPRVHRLMKTSVARGGYVAVMLSAEEELSVAGIPDSTSAPNFMAQSNISLPEFTDRLIDLLME